MTPLEIEVLLHCYTCPAPHPRIEAPEVVRTIKTFESIGIIEKTWGDCYHTTERGKAMVRLLCSIPFPKQQWVDEHGNVIKTT